MKDNIPFIIPENDINLRIARFLTIIDTLPYTQRGKLVINIDKLIIFDFLVKNPFLLRKVLEVKHRIKLKLLNEEYGSVTTLFPSKMSLVDIQSAKELIKLMISYNMLKVEEDKEELFYTLSDNGKSIFNELDTEYVIRIKELCKTMLVLRSLGTSELKKIINPLVKGI
ncbi:ABC-three component system middle component 4 [Bacillus infantis]|uniref:ABC-three component system middle component 4 n=1 Tax=Bacillus infantis TaxID=324767 RepID=UPI003982797D